MSAQDEHTGLQVSEFNNEPEWLKISWKYEALAKETARLNRDLGRYKAALNELDGAGTDVGFGKERIFLLREEIAEMEAAAK